jgi:hypothetical protein
MGVWRTFTTEIFVQYESGTWLFFVNANHVKQDKKLYCKVRYTICCFKL